MWILFRQKHITYTVKEFKKIEEIVPVLKSLSAARQKYWQERIRTLLPGESILILGQVIYRVEGYHD